MSISNILGKDGKIVDGVLPNPYPFPASVSGLGQVLAVNNSALTPTGPPTPQSIIDVATLGCADILAPFGTIQSFSSDLIQSAGGLGNLGIFPVNNLTLKGCQTKGSMLVGDGTSSKELIVPVAPALPNGSVLILDSNEPLGMKWGGEAGDINSITPGNNIDITGPTANPIVAVRNPLNATLNIGTQNLIAGSDPATTFNSTTNALGTTYQSGGVAGGPTMALYGNTLCSLTSGNKIIEIDGTQLRNTDQSVGTQTIQTTLTPTSITINNQDNIGGGFIRTTRVANEYAISGDDINVNGTGSASMNVAPGTTSTIALGSSAHPAPPFFSPPQAQINIQTNCSLPTPNASITLQSSGQFLPSNITTIDKDGINQNNSSGAGLTITSNALNCSIVSGAVASMTGGTANTASVSCATGAITASGDTQVFTSGLAGAVATPNFTMRNSNVAPTSYPSLKLDKSGVAAPAAGTISAISSWAVDATGTSREWSRIQTKTENVGVGNQDGTLSIFNSVNGVVSETFNFNGGQNENNCFRPLDMNNQQIRSNNGDLTLTTTASTGTGKISLNAKEDISMTAKQFDLTTQPTSPATAFAGIYLDSAGGMELQADGTLQITGTNKTTGSVSGASGLYLSITINGTPYKIELLTP